METKKHIPLVECQLINEDGMMELQKSPCDNHHKN